MKFKRAVFALGFLAAAATVYAEEPPLKIGSVCIAPVSKADRDQNHSGPAEKKDEKYTYEFSVQIDGGERVRVPRKVPFLVTDLETTSKHRVIIRDGSKQIESFYFTFAERGGDSLCLWFTPFYQTWSLGPPEKKPWCRCHEEPHN